jgi:hypothetical protein
MIAWRRGCASDRVHLRGASGLPRAAGGWERERMADVLTRVHSRSTRGNTGPNLNPKLIACKAWNVSAFPGVSWYNGQATHEIERWSRRRGD